MSVPLTGLTSTTTYHARLVAVSAGGTTNGPDLVFTTGDVPPSVANTAAGSITTSGATISGDVNPNRVATTYSVEYGTTAGLRLADHAGRRGLRLRCGRGERAAHAA